MAIKDKKVIRTASTDATISEQKAYKLTELNIDKVQQQNKQYKKIGLRGFIKKIGVIEQRKTKGNIRDQ